MDDTVAFEEANMIIVCKKLYHGNMPPENFDAKENDKNGIQRKTIILCTFQKL